MFGGVVSVSLSFNFFTIYKSAKVKEEILGGISEAGMMEVGS